MTSLAEPSPLITTKNGITNHTNSSPSSIFSTPKWPSSRRTLSFSSSSFSSNSSSSFRSFSHEDEEISLPNSPSTSSFPHVSSGGIPFSWESIPGIPKKQTLNTNDSSRKLTNPSSKKYLPLPPAASLTSGNSNKKSNDQKKHYITTRDPFFTALVECSKDGDVEDDDKDAFGGTIWKTTTSKSLSTRFGFVNMSCKNVSSIAESLVFLPNRGGPNRRRIPYNVVKKRSI